jgi:hypothetical protein
VTLIFVSAMTAHTSSTPIYAVPQTRSSDWRCFVSAIPSKRTYPARFVNT